MTAAVATPALCEYGDCGHRADYVIVRDGLRKRVCRKCMQEQVALVGLEAGAVSWLLLLSAFFAGAAMGMLIVVVVDFSRRSQ